MRKLLLAAIIMACGITASLAQSSDNAQANYNAQLNEKKSQRQTARQAELSKPWKAQYIIGANVVYENNFPMGRAMGAGSGAWRFNPGISFAAHITRHSGVEIGVNYRVAGGTAARTGPEEPANYSNRYISIPVVYKYYNRILNVVAGVNYDFMINSSYGDIKRLSSAERNIFGIVVGVTKDIRLGRGMILEPYVHLNPNTLNHPYMWVGVGVGLKYAFR